MNIADFILSQRNYYFENMEMVLSAIKPDWFNCSPISKFMSFGDQIDHLSAVECNIIDEIATTLGFDKIPFEYKSSTNLKSAVEQYYKIRLLSDNFIKCLSNERLEFRFLTVSHMHLSVYQMINMLLEHEVYHRSQLATYLRIMKFKNIKEIHE